MKGVFHLILKALFFSICSVFKQVAYIKLKADWPH